MRHVLVSLLVVLATGCTNPPEQKIEVIYFHRTLRCPSCELIEAWTRAAIAEDVHSRGVIWRTVNLDEPANRQFEEKYDLAAQSVVLRLKKGNSEVKWKNLDKVWDLLDDEASFQKYIRDELGAFVLSS